MDLSNVIAQKDVTHSSVDVSGSIYGSNDDIYDSCNVVFARQKSTHDVEHDRVDSTMLGNWFDSLKEDMHGSIEDVKKVQGVHYLQSATNEGSRLLVLDRRCKCLSQEKTESLANAGVEAGAVMPELDVSRLSFPQYKPSYVWDKVTQLIEVVVVGNALYLIILRSWLSVFYYFTGDYMFSVYYKQGERGLRYHCPSLATFCGFGERGRSTLLFGVFDHAYLIQEYVADYPEFPPLLYLGAVDMKLQLDISNESIPMVVANACQLSDLSAKQKEEIV
ncbi:hypothetical protein SASPL_134010 [Salvia splendens]|uniref:Uncharacterized protein n=1 Tax=Salvia splendens TaxID=180675 RepID=A0A8X8X2D3_SALSN|nr:hypothetical protein SASPL_134010 [Salvia splendens]